MIDAIMKVPNLITGLSGVAVSTVVPFVANKDNKNAEENTLNFYIFGQIIYISIIVFLVSFFIFYSSFFLEYFFNLGGHYSKIVFTLLLVACAINCLTFGANFLMARKEKLFQVTAYRLIVAFFKLISNSALLFIGFGIMSIGYTSIASSIFVLIILSAIKQTFKFNSLMFIFVIFIASIISIGVCYLVFIYMPNPDSIYQFFQLFFISSSFYVFINLLILLLLKNFHLTKSRIL